MRNEVVKCVIDTETVGGAGNPKGAYNFGAVFMTNTKILAKVSILVMELYDDINKDSYAKKNFHLYEERKNDGTMTCVATEEDAYKIILGLCRFYNVKYVMAYNSGFDFGKTICKELLNEFEFIDIYLMALETITTTKMYRNFCIENGYLTPSKKYISTTAEIVYRFITNNLEFVEEHTALRDAEIEMIIYLECLRTHKKYTKNVHGNLVRNGKHCMI